MSKIQMRYSVKLVGKNSSSNILQGRSVATFDLSEISEEILDLYGSKLNWIQNCVIENVIEELQKMYPGDWVADFKILSLVILPN